MSAGTIPTPATTRSTTLARGTAVLTATGSALTLWLIAGPVLGADLTVAQGAGTSTVGLASVLLTAVLTGLIGWGLLAGLERVTRRARVIWITVAALVLLVSLVGPLAATTPGGAVALLCLHLAVGLPLISLLGRSAA